MAINVLATLQTFEKDGGISITPEIQAEFGQAIGTVIQNIFSGSVSVNGATFQLSGNEGLATFTGTGTAAPLLSGFSITAVFTATSTDVTMQLNGSIQTTIALSDAWPSVLNVYPFNKITLASGTLALTVDPGDTSFDLMLSPTLAFEGTTVGTGLFEVQYANSALGFLGGFLAEGSWTPSSDIPILSNLKISGEGGVFFSTITATDLSAFKGFPFVPKQITPGMTFLAEITLDDSLSALKDFLASGATLQLTAIVPQDGGLAKASVEAELANISSPGNFSIQDFTLTWQSTSADSGTITVAVDATIDLSPVLDLKGSGTFTYGATPSIQLTLDLTTPGGWVAPFGISNLTVVDIEFIVALVEEGIDLAMAGDFIIGTGAEAVTMNAAMGVVDFELPSFLSAELSAADKTKPVTLAALVDDFIPTLNLSTVPLLNNITFTDLLFWACDAPLTVQGKSYLPGVGASGTISFYGYELDFAFSLTSSPVAVKAMGSISYQGGPIVITGAGVTWLTLSDSTGKLGPSACIDTTASGYCVSPIPNAYFSINATVGLLGLFNLSVVAAANSSMFEMDVDISTAGHVFSEDVHVFIDPSSNNFAASSDMDFSPPSLTFPGLWPIPSFTIPTPQLAICLAFGTTVPSPNVAVCSDGWTPSNAPYFHFDLSFSWGSFNFHVEINLDLSVVYNVFNNFGQFIIDWLESQINAQAILGFLLDTAEILGKFLLSIGQAVSEAAQAVAQFFKMAFEDAYNLVSSIWDELSNDCSAVAADAGLTSGMSSEALSTREGRIQTTQVAQIPDILARLTKGPQGEALLYHYYLHRAEADKLMAKDPTVSPLVQSRVEAHRASPQYEAGVHLPLVIDVLRITAQAGSAEYQQSVVEVIEGLEPHRDKTYDELLVLVETV